MEVEALSSWGPWVVLLLYTDKVYGAQFCFVVTMKSFMLCLFAEF